MADIKATLYSFLSMAPTVTALVDTRIYPNWAPPSTQEPYLILSRIDGNDFAAHLGSASNNIQSTIQIDVWGQTSVQVEGIVEALRVLLDGFFGMMGSDFIYSFRLTSAFDGPLAPTDGGADATARTTLTFEAWHT